MLDMKKTVSKVKKRIDLTDVLAYKKHCFFCQLEIRGYVNTEFGKAVATGKSID